MSIITISWRPATKTSKALLKAGYSQKQLDTIGKAFVKRYINQRIESASTVFSKMVRTSGAGQNVKNKKETTLQDLNENLSHKSINSLIRIQEIKNTSTNPQMIKSMIQLLCKRFDRNHDNAYKNQLAQMFDKNNNKEQ